MQTFAIDRKIVIKEIVSTQAGKEQVVVYASQYYQTELHTAQMLHELNLKDTADEPVIREKIRRIQKSRKY